MRVATWNVNGLRARFDFVLHWLRSRRPDVVGLQELKLTDDKFPYLELKAEGYEAVTHTQKAWNGVAILSHEKPRLTQGGLPGQEEQGARLVSAQVGGLDFTTVYCPNGKGVGHADFALKLQWFDTLAEYLRRRPLENVVVCGDFNICPTAADTWSEERLGGQIFHTAEERSRFQRLLGAGLIDLYRDLNPDGSEYSWWDYRGGAFHRNQGLRIDFLLASPQVRRRVRAVRTDREYRRKKDGLTASDHAPVIADLE